MDIASQLRSSGGRKVFAVKVGIMNKFVCVALAIAISSVASSASATSYTFDLTFDGTSLTPTNVGSGLAGVGLNVGDDFVLTVRAAGNGFWTTTTSSFSLPINPALNINALTSGNAVSTGFLDGAVVFVETETPSGRCCAELGPNSWSLPIGLTFDEVVLSYTLLSSDASFGFDGGLWNTPFDGATFTAAPAVPLPAALPLFASGLGALGLLGWRRKRKNAAVAAA